MCGGAKCLGRLPWICCSRKRTRSSSEQSWLRTGWEWWVEELFVFAWTINLLKGGAVCVWKLGRSLILEQRVKCFLTQNENFLQALCSRRNKCLHKVQRNSDSGCVSLACFYLLLLLVWLGEIWGRNHLWFDKYLVSQPLTSTLCNTINQWGGKEESVFSYNHQLGGIIAQMCTKKPINVKISAGPESCYKLESQTRFTKHGKPFK